MSAINGGGGVRMQGFKQLALRVHIPIYPNFHKTLFSQCTNPIVPVAVWLNNPIPFPFVFMLKNLSYSAAWIPFFLPRKTPPSSHFT